jgi:methylase of polypeptide subunit release factors
MIANDPTEPVDPLPRQSVDRLRADLTGYTVDAVDALLGPMAHAALGREQALPARLELRSRLDDPLAVLVSVFILGLELPRRRLASALPSLGVDGAVRLGLVQESGPGPGDAVRAAVDLRPYAAVDALGAADWCVVSDPGELATGRPLAADHVLGVGGASVTLARSTVRQPVERVLDLGTGCGVQALHAARHARTVVGTDVSTRALRTARLNWLLNEPSLGGAELSARHGSLLEPVAGERFDLVVSNPPFVITPRTAPSAAYEYRDAGLVGDELVRRLVTSVGDVLRPGGVAQFLGNWEDRDGEPWADRVREWLAGSGLDGWVVQRELQDPAEYAETWIRDAGQHRGKGAEELYEAWLDDFAARQVRAVGFGLVTLRRPLRAAERPSWARVEERRSGPGLPTGAEVAAGLAAQDWLTLHDDHDDQGLLAATFTVAPDVTEERHHRPGEEDPAVILLRQGGTGRAVQASTALAGFVGACSGDLSAGRLVGALATLLEVPVADLAAELVPAVRALVADGLLLPRPG